MTPRKTAAEWAREAFDCLLNGGLIADDFLPFFEAAQAQADREGFERAREACALTAERAAEQAEKHLKGGDAAPALMMFSGVIRALPYAPPEETEP